MVHIISSLFVATLAATTAFASSAPSCDTNNLCPEEWPCCSQYGQCGTGAYCLGGCDPLSSYSLDACTPEPICVSKTYSSFDNLDNAASNDAYLGDASKYDWTYTGTPKVQDGNLLLTMPANSTGSLMANNHYIWYGKMTGTMKSSRGAGVVTGFILLSDTKDEIDLEFVGADLTNVQTNYYFQGILDYDNEVNASVPGGDTFDDWHTYEVDWQPDYLTWSVDGTVKRTLYKNETFNSTANRYQYPQTPSRMQLSLWPAGLSTNAEGTIAWAGGEINWDSTDIQEVGYYYATWANITVECYSPPSDATIKGSEAYIFTNSDGLESAVEIVNNSTVLASFGATGLDMTLGSNTTTSGNATSTSNSVPSGNGGTGNEPGSSSTGSSSSGSSSSSTSSSGFSQGSGSGTSTKSGAASPNERVLKGSFFAVLVAVVVLVTL